MINIIQNGKQIFPVLTFKCDICECVVESDEYKSTTHVIETMKLDNGDCAYKVEHVMTCPNCKSTMREYKRWSINEA